MTSYEIMKLCPECGLAVYPNTGPNDIIHFACCIKVHKYMRNKIKGLKEGLLKCQCEYHSCHNTAIQAVNKKHTYHRVLSHWLGACQSCNETCYNEYSKSLYGDKKRTMSPRSPTYRPGDKTLIRRVLKAGSTAGPLAYITFPKILIGSVVELKFPDGSIWDNIVVKKDNNIAGCFRSRKLLPYMGQEVIIILKNPEITIPIS